MFMASPRGGGACAVQTASGLGGGDDAIDPADASATLSFSATSGYAVGNGSSGEIIDPATCPNGAFEIQLVISGDSPDSGPTPIGAGNWYTLPVSWTWNQTVVGTKSATFTATIRQITDTGNSGTFSGGISANVDPPE
jgi:hypothetical protein